MTTDIKLLPLPELPVAVERFILSSLGPVKREGAVTALRTMLREYARANVAHAIALLQAEIEALRAEVDAAKDKAEFYRTERNKNHRKAERLEEALLEAYGQVRELCDCYGHAYPEASFARYEALMRDQKDEVTPEVFGWVYGDGAFVEAKFWTADEPPKGWTPVYTAAKDAEIEALRGESARTKRYVQGVGWCWVEDGEVIEVISEAT